MKAMPAHALYEGTIEHWRSAPAHRFRYRLQFVYLDLDELPQAFAGRWLWSAGRPSLAWFRRADHLGAPSESLASCIRQLLAERGIAANGPIRLLTQLRYFGFVMNPVSFYFCYDADGQTLRAVVAEVNNTPWGEQHCYVLPVPADSPSNGGSPEVWLEKAFHVSPFMSLDYRYRFELTAPAESLQIQIENFQNGECQFRAQLQLQRRPWTTWELHRGLWLHPLMTQRIYAGIYWQALRLWWKGATYHPHPGVPPINSQPIISKEQAACRSPG